MFKANSYFDLAEEDYNFLKEDYEQGRYGNVMCYCSQLICEWYLKDVVDTYCTEQDNTEILRTHNVKKLHSFIKENFDDFSCDWSKVLLVNGYYSDARCPGDDAMITTREDTEMCCAAVVETRRAVVKFLEEHEVE